MTKPKKVEHIPTFNNMLEAHRYAKMYKLVLWDDTFTGLYHCTDYEPTSLFSNLIKDLRCQKNK